MRTTVFIQNMINYIMQTIDSYSAETLIILFALLLLSSIILLSASIKMKRTTKIYKQLIQSSSGIDLERFLTENLEMFYDVSNQIKDIEDMFNNFKVNLDQCYKKMGIVRYDAFEDMGGEISFAVALLDTGNNGFILNCIHGRNENRTYLKPIKSGKSEYQLSGEEKKALERALR
jgi:hypothetical protein